MEENDHTSKDEDAQMPIDENTQKNSYDVEKEATNIPRSEAQSCWGRWLSIAGYLNKSLEKFYYKYGLAVAGHPKPIIAICILVTGGLCFGITRIKMESRTEKLYVPQNSRAEIDLKNADQFFSIQTRIAKVIIVRDDKSNVLTPDTFEVSYEVMESIVNHTSIEKVCLKGSGKGWPNIRNATSACVRTDPFQLFNYSTQAMRNNNVVQTVNMLMANPDYLMLNGRPLATSVGEIFGKHKQDNNGNIHHASALRIIFPIKSPNTDHGYSEVLRWEKEFLKHMKSLKDPFKRKGLDLYFFTFRSVDDSIESSTGGDIMYISLTFAIMCTFTCLALSRFRDVVTGHGLAGIVGLIVVCMGVASGFGLVILCGTKFTATVGILPFLILGVAIDDMFIILDELDRTNFNLPTKEIIAKVLGQVGGSITMTTMTDLVAFAVSTTSAFPAIRYFCTFAAVGITFAFLMIMTCFVAFLVFDINRIKAGRHDMVPFCKQNSFRIDQETGLLVKPKNSISTRVMKVLGQIITTKYGSACVLLIALGLVTAGIYGALNISQKFTLQMLGKDGSDYIEFLDTETAYFAGTYPVSIVVPGEFNLDNEANQEEYLKLSRHAIEGNTLMLNRSVNWLEDFKAWSKHTGSNITGRDFLTSLHVFLRIPKYRQYYSDIRIGNNLAEIKGSRVIVFMRETADSNKGKDSMLKLWESIDTKSPIKPHIAAVPFVYFEQYVLVVPETIRNVIICGITVLFMTSPFLLHPGILMLMVLSFASLIIELLGLMTLWNVSLNSISMIVLTMAIGFCVDYSAHVAHAYITSDATKSKDATVSALSTVGASVFMGGFTTFLGMLVTAFSSSEVFRIFFKMFFGIVTLGLIHGLIILPTLLSVFQISRVDRTASNEKDDSVVPVKTNSVNAESPVPENCPDAKEEKV